MNVTMFPVGDLEIDLPISELNAQQKVTSIKANGLIQPITVWLGGDKPRIIDGFHRLEAYRRIGRTEIPAITQDCTEEAFWDARIQSAKQHHEIERDRLLSWIAECWAASRLCAKMGEEWGGILGSLATELWEKTQGHNSGWELPKELDGWIITHAKKWGCSPNELLEGILGVFRRTNMFAHNLDVIAKKHGLSLPDRIALDEISLDGRAFGCNHVDAFLQTKPDVISADAFLAHIVAARDDEARKKHDECIRIDKTSSAEWETRGDEKYIRKALLSWHRRIDSLVMGENAAVLQSMHDGPELIAEFGVFSRDTINKLWPSSNTEKWEIPSVLEELAKLRRELAKEHDLRIRAEAQLLEREKRSAKLQEKLEGVVAWPSGK